MQFLSGFYSTFRHIFIMQNNIVMYDNYWYNEFVLHRRNSMLILVSRFFLLKDDRIMRLSTWAMNRIVEQEMAGNNARLDALRAKGKVLMMDVRNMTDKDILDKLNSIGLSINREIVGELCIKHISAESLAMWLEKDRKIEKLQ
jgi:hypothetical protein